MKNRTLAAVTTALIVSLLAGVQISNIASANPYSEWWVWYQGEAAPPYNAKAPEILVTSPAKSQAYSTSEVPLSINVSVVLPCWLIYEVNCKTDWQQNTITLFKNKGDPVAGGPSFDGGLEVNLTSILRDVPEGNHSIIVNATGRGSYHVAEGDHHYYGFFINNSVTINFTVDLTAPSITVDAPENKTYTTTIVPLNFYANETVMQLTYNLDGQGNVTITGNTTLTGLQKGLHTIIVFGNDRAGNAGTSQIRCFTVDTGFPTVSILAPGNTIYDSNQIQLNYLLQEPNLLPSYSLNGQANVTLNGNITLNNLPYGFHSLTVYATDDLGNTATDRVEFTVFPVALAAVSVGLSAAVIGVGLFVYLRKRH